MSRPLLAYIPGASRTERRINLACIIAAVPTVLAALYELARW